MATMNLRDYTKAGRSQYGPSKYEAMMKNIVGPIPRTFFQRLAATDRQYLADEIVKTWVLRKAQQSPRIVMDLRMLRYFDPEQMSDQWQNWLTAEPLPKLKSKGLAVEMYNLAGAAVEAMVGLLAGNKPMAYVLDVMPQDATSELSIARADITEKIIYREQKDQGYPLIYQDLVGYLVAIGRAARMVTVHPTTRRLRTQVMWPGNVQAFWQEDQRTIEQVYIVRNLTPGEAIDLYPDKEDDILAAVHGPKFRDRALNAIFDGQSEVSIINCWYRLGSWGDEKIGMSSVLMGSEWGAKRESTNVMLDLVEDTEFPDIPLKITPRFKIMDKPPDEATGSLWAMAGIQTDFNETFSAYRDMIWRAIYQRYKAKGFTHRNAPRLIPGTNIYPLPRPDQDIERLDEVLNTVPIEQVLTRQEKMLVTLPGLNNYFLGVAPPSETSGEAISAAIHASITRLEPVRMNIQSDEVWMYELWLGLLEKYGEYESDGRKINARDIIDGQRGVELRWRDVAPKDAIKAKQMAIAAAQGGIISTDTARDEWPILSKTDEARKVERERKDVYSNPENVSQTASALIQMAQAFIAQRQLGVAGQMPGQPGSGEFGQVQAKADEAMVTANARGAAPTFESDNSKGGVMPPTQKGQRGNRARPAPGGRR